VEPTVSQSSRPAVILLVEDNPDDAELTQRAFQRNRLGSCVVVKRDGQEALDYLFGNGDQAPAEPLPNVIVLDLDMPRINGLELLQRLRAEPRTHAIPVVVLTTSDEVGDITDSYQRGANSYVHKPVDTKEFFSAIQSLEQYWTVRNIPPPPAT